MKVRMTVSRKGSAISSIVFGGIILLLVLIEVIVNLMSINHHADFLPLLACYLIGIFGAFFVANGILTLNQVSEKGFKILFISAGILNVIGYFLFLSYHPVFVLIFGIIVIVVGILIRKQ